MRTTPTIGMIAILMLPIYLFCCSSGNQGAIIEGKWIFNEAIKDGKRNLEHTDYLEGTTLEFLSDKTWLFTGGPNDSGNWVILDDGRIKMDSIYGIYAFCLIKNNKLTFIRKGASIECFSKMNCLESNWF